MTTTEITALPDVETLRGHYESAMVAASVASRYTGRAVALALRAGKTFRAVKHFAPKGSDFREIIREAIPELPDTTIDKWIRMEEQSGDLLSNPSKLKQAFLSIGLLPEQEPGEASEKESKPWLNYVAHIGRAERAIREQVSDFGTLTTFERETLKKRLAPLVEIFKKL